MTISTLSPNNSDLTSSNANNIKPFDFSKLGDRKEQEKLVAWVTSEYTRIRQRRFRVEQQWYLNLAFYLGRQNVVSQVTNTNVNGVAGQVGRLTMPKAPYWRSRPVHNKIRRFLRKEHSKIVAQKPNCYIVPATADDSDTAAAQAGEQIWESMYQQHKVDMVMRRSAWWMLWCGTSFVKVYWNDNIKDPVTDEQGDLCIEPVTAFHLLVPDMVEQDLEAQPYVMHISTKDINWIKLNYPKTLSGDPIKPNANAANTIFDAAFINLIQATNLEQNSVLVMEMWIKPGRHAKFPNGGMVTIAGNQIVQAVDGWPYEHNEYPFIKLDHVAAAKFYSDSSCVDLIPLQREYNRTHGQIIEAKNRMGKPQLIAPLGAIDPKKITSEPGQVISYKPGFQKPEPLPIQALPSYIMEEAQAIAADMDDIVGQHDVSSGQMPPGVTAATAIAYLHEEDDTIIADTIASMEQGYEKMGRQVLALCVQYWNVERTVKVVGADGSFDVLTLSVADLRGNTDLRVEAGSGLPLSKAARTATIMDLMKMGFVDANTGLQLMEIGGAQKLYEEIQVDTRQAQRENIKMSRQDIEELLQHFEMAEALESGQQPEMPGQMPGQQMPEQMGMPGQAPEMGMDQEPQPLPVPVNTWDNHQAHIATHNKFRKSQGFEVLPDAIKQLFEEHVQMHEAALMQTMPPPDPNSPNQPPEPGGGQPPMPDNGEGGQPMLPGMSMEAPPNG